MLMFTLAISCLTASSFPWFMDLTFQVPIHYCSLQHRILLSSPDKSTAECHVHFGPATSFILGQWVILLCSSPVDTIRAGVLLCSCHIYIYIYIYIWSFIHFMRFLWQVYWHSLPFPSPVDNVYQNSLLWPFSLEWLCTTWLRASLSYASPFTTTR